MSASPSIYLKNLADLSAEQLKAEQDRLMDAAMNESDADARGALSAKMLVLQAIAEFLFPETWIKLRRAA